MAETTSPADRQHGPYALMSFAHPGHFRTGNDWAALSGDTDLLTQMPPATEDPGEDCIYVEIVSRSPDFPQTSGLDHNDDLMRKDVLRWKPRLNDLVFHPSTGEVARLIGLHADQHDFYYRFRSTGGAESFFSMVVALELLRPEMTEQAYGALDRQLCEDGAPPSNEFLVTREIDKPWPRPSASAAHVRLLTAQTKMIFGPFETPADWENFQSKVGKLPGMGFTTAWKSSMAQDPSYRGTTAPDNLDGVEVADFQSMETDDLLGLMLEGVLPEGDDGPVAFSFS